MVTGIYLNNTEEVISKLQIGILHHYPEWYHYDFLPGAEDSLLNLILIVWHFPLIHPDFPIEIIIRNFPNTVKDVFRTLLAILNPIFQAIFPT